MRIRESLPVRAYSKV